MNRRLKRISNSFIVKGCFFCCLLLFFAVSLGLCRQELEYSNVTGLWTYSGKDTTIEPYVGLSGEELRYDAYAGTWSHNSKELNAQIKAATTGQGFFDSGEPAVSDSFKNESTDTTKTEPPLQGAAPNILSEASSVLQVFSSLFGNFSTGK